MGLCLLRCCLGNKQKVHFLPGLIFLILLLGNNDPAGAQAPIITSFSPTTICQGKTVTITGTDFDNATIVRVGTVNASNFVVNNSTTITAIVADNAASGTIVVTTPNGAGTSATTLNILPSPKPVLTDLSTLDAPFTNCNGSATYTLRVGNNSAITGTNNTYQIDWGDNSPVFTQTDWPGGAQTTHSYNSQGYFPIIITITSPNGCSRSETYQFYNGRNPLASFTTTNSTTGLCVSAAVEFQLGNWFNNSTGTTYQVNFGDGSPNLVLNHPLNPANIN